MTQTQSQTQDAQPGQWFFALNNAQHGPVSIEDLRQMLAAGTLGPDSLVWTPGMERWTMTAQVPELADVAPTGPRQLQYGLTPAHYVTAMGVEYASFWRRFASSFIDGILVGIVNGLMEALFEVLFAVLGGGPNTMQQRRMITAMSWAASTSVGWLYVAMMQSSVHQATLGMMAMKIVVTDIEGRRITFARATGRYFAAMLSWMICLIGYLMMLWTEKKQTLHDIIAKTLIVKRPG